MEDDSVKLLRECNAGIKMGISSIDDVMNHVQNDGLRGVLKDSHDIHCRLGDDTHKMLINYHDEGKEPAPMAKAMAKMKSNGKNEKQFQNHGRKPGLRHRQSDYRWLQHGNQIPVPLLKPVSGSG